MKYAGLFALPVLAIVCACILLLHNVQVSEPIKQTLFWLAGISFWYATLVVAYSIGRGRDRSVYVVLDHSVDADQLRSKCYFADKAAAEVDAELMSEHSQCPPAAFEVVQLTRRH